MSRKTISHSPSSSKSIPVYSSGRLVGKVTGDTFHKSIMGSRHILRTPRAIAISCDALDQAEQAGAVNIIITDQETGNQYHASLAHFRQAAFELDRGFGRQLALVIDGWVRTSKGQPLVTQLSLFPGGVR